VRTTQIIRQVLPRPVVTALKTYLERYTLSGVTAPATFDASALRASSHAPLSAGLRDDRLEPQWRTVEKQIARFAIPDGTGGMNLGDRRAVYHLVSALQPASVLEIGTHIGASTVHVAAALRDHGRQGQRRLVSVDIRDVNDPAAQPWRAYGAAHSPAEMVRALGCDFVEFVARDSLAYLAARAERFDLIFLDGDHSARAVYREVPAALQRLAPGGVVLLHDYFPGMRPLWSDGAVIAGPWLAIERLRREGLPVIVEPLGELPWPTKQGSSTTSLALLLRRG
jgi:predicted O-methyltransferase YrrM